MTQTYNRTGIYQIVNTANGKIYVGSAVNFEKRWKEHLRQLTEKRHHSILLQRAWDKYGEAAFSFQKLIFCAKENLIWFEQRFIDALSPAFNVCKVAGSVLGYRHTPEAKEAARLRATGNTHCRGKTLPEETKERIRQNRKGKGCYPCPPERAKKISEAQKGRPVSAEKRAVLSERNTGKKQSAETIVKRMRSIYGDDWVPRGNSVAEIAARRAASKLARGAAPRAGVLSAEVVRAIREDMKIMRRSEVSNKYGVEGSILSRIKNGKIYKWVA